MIIEKSRRELKYREEKRKQISRKRKKAFWSETANRTQMMRSSVNNSKSLLFRVFPLAFLSVVNKPNSTVISLHP